MRLFCALVFSFLGVQTFAGAGGDQQNSCDGADANKRIIALQQELDDMKYLIKDAYDKLEAYLKNEENFQVAL